MYFITCNLCQNIIEFKYKARFEQLDSETFKCRRCRHLIEKECVICEKPFISLDYNKARICSDSCKFKLIAMEKSDGKCINISQISEIKQRVTDNGRYFSKNPPIGDSNPMYGRKHSEQAKILQRIRRVASLKKRFPVFPGYNPDSIIAIEEYGRMHGYTFMHAENGGEFYVEVLGYFVDGYDPIHNVVIEFDEAHHYRKDGKLREKDRKRQEEIENVLNCKFIRLKG